MPDDGCHDLEEFCTGAGLRINDPRIPDLYSVIPGGRACTALRDCYIPIPARSWETENCLWDLLNTTHFHIDLYGNLFTGLCAGMVASEIDDYHCPISPEAKPVFHRLCEYRLAAYCG